MIPHYYLWQANRRLVQSKQTMQMMEPDVPPMVEAQHEMIEREVEYWREESNKFTIFALTFVIAACIMVSLYLKGLFHV